MNMVECNIIYSNNITGEPCSEETGNGLSSEPYNQIAYPSEKLTLHIQSAGIVCVGFVDTQLMQLISSLIISQLMFICHSVTISL